MERYFHEDGPWNACTAEGKASAGAAETSGQADNQTNGMLANLSKAMKEHQGL